MKNVVLFLRFAVSTVLVCAMPAWAQPPVLSANGVNYQGQWLQADQVQAFYGVPFAQPPVDDLRWQAPRPLHDVGPAAGRVLAHATQFAAACYQGPHIAKWYRGVVESFGGDPDTVLQPPVAEDCLYLNIWAPAGAEPGSLPVMVYVHGGSNKGGFSFEPNYHGEHLAAQGVVVVSVAYRLGIFGFFSHPELQQSNFALLDIAAALRWVKAHVSAVGGDAGNITLVGESAGGNNIIHLIASDSSHELFQRAVVQSAGWAMDSKVTRAASLATGEQADADLAGGKGLAALRQVSAQALLEHAERMALEFDPVVDGDTVTAPVADWLVSAGPLPDLLIGSNADEWKMYLDESASLTQWFEDSGLTPDQIAALSYELGEAALADERSALDRLITAQQFVCPSLALARQTRAAGAASYVYLFARQRAGEQAATMGAYHGAELPYVFNTHDSWLPTSAVDHAITERMMRAWLNFAAQGDPNPVSGDGLMWPEFDQRSLAYRLDTTDVVLPHRDSRLCQLLRL